MDTSRETIGVIVCLVHLGGREGSENLVPHFFLVVSKKVPAPRINTAFILYSINALREIEVECLRGTTHLTLGEKRLQSSRLWDISSSDLLSLAMCV